MALPEKMSGAQTLLLYGGLGLVALAAVVVTIQSSPCSKMRRDFERNWKDLDTKEARSIMSQAERHGCSWPAQVTEEVGW